MQAAIRAGLREEMFLDPEARSVFSHISKHYRAAATKKQFPTLDFLKTKFPAFDYMPMEEDVGQLESIIGDLRHNAEVTELIGAARTFQDLVHEEDYDEAKKFINDSIAKIRRRLGGSTSGFGVHDIIDGVIRSYEEAQTGAQYGVPWPWECLTEDTMGKRPGDFIVFYGRMKSMKTWILLFCAAVDYLFYNQRVMIWSKEMNEPQLRLRLGSIFAEVDYQLLKKGRLPPHVYDRAVQRLREVQEILDESNEDMESRARQGTRDILVLAGQSAPLTIEGIESAIEEFGPDVVYLDSFYHLRSERAERERQMWARIQYLAEDLKNLAMGEQVPIIAAAQANRLGEKLAGENLSEVAGSDAIAREADLIMRVLRKVVSELDEPEYEGYYEEMKEKAERAKATRRLAARPGFRTRIPKKVLMPEEAPIRRGAEICLVLGGNRDGTLEAFTINCIPGYDFSVNNPSLTYEEVKKWLKEDMDAAEKEIKKAVKRQQQVKDNAPVGRFVDHRKRR
jgi:replicative DNA helicase